MLTDHTGSGGRGKTEALNMAHVMTVRQQSKDENESRDTMRHCNVL